MTHQHQTAYYPLRKEKITTFAWVWVPLSSGYFSVVLNLPGLWIAMAPFATLTVSQLLQVDIFCGLAHALLIWWNDRIVRSHFAPPYLLSPSAAFPLIDTSDSQREAVVSGDREHNSLSKNIRTGTLVILIGTEEGGRIKHVGSTCDSYGCAGGTTTV